MAQDVWASGDAYEAYIGRWSRQVARSFVRWLNVPTGRRWLDVGCGTGALTATVLAIADPTQITAVDPAEGFLTTARANITDPRATFRAGDAQSLPLPDNAFDAVVSGLALNFVPEPHRAAAELARVTTPSGITAAYVWNYAAGGMALIQHFWDAAIALDPAAADLEEVRRFPLCYPEPLTHLWQQAGLTDVAVEPIVIPTVFADFDDYWQPFLGGQGPAPGYLMSLPDHRRQALRDLLHARLPRDPDGSIPLTARAWAIRGTRERQPSF